MTGLNLHGRAWSLAATQHGVVSHAQLRELGLSRHAIAHRVERGRLHRVFRGVYAVGRPELTRHGRWMAAVLGSGSGACLSHCSAAALWGLSTRPQDYVDVSIPASTVRRLPGITTQRRVPSLLDDAVLRDGIPVTSLVTTLSDLMLIWTRDEVEAAINAADRLGLTDPVALRESLEGRRPWPGSGVVKTVLDLRTFTLTDSELERRFLPIARRAGLPPPATQEQVNGFRVDFYWPELGLVVETDGLTYHRTPAQQAADRVRDQTHAAAGLTPLRFTRAQVRFEPARVERTLAAVARRLTTGSAEALSRSGPA